MKEAGRTLAVTATDTGQTCLGCPVQPLSETSAMRVLLVEDHKPLARALRQGLEEENFAVDLAADGEEADVKARNTGYDVIILDLMLPKIDGMTLLRRWRADGIRTHVLVLTAKGSVED